MDGNRRYAKEKKFSLADGHKLGANTFVKILEWCFKVGIKNVTAFAFSIENFNRPPKEIEMLFALLRQKLHDLSARDFYFCKLHQARIKIIGNKWQLPADINNQINFVENKTKQFNRHILFIAFPYTSRDDIAHSIAKVAGNFNVHHHINVELIEKNFYFDGLQIPVDLIIRTSGYYRLSDFMLWQSQQSVIEYPATLWPNYSILDLSWSIFKWGYYNSTQRGNKHKVPYKLIVNNHPPFVSANKVA